MQTLETKAKHVEIRVARWYIFNPKIPIWVNFGGSCNGRFLCMLWLFGPFSGNLVYFMALWYILWSFGLFFPVLVYCNKRNLATLFEITRSGSREFNDAIQGERKI
jgi:hypothetical protein